MSVPLISGPIGGGAADDPQSAPEKDSAGDPKDSDPDGDGRPKDRGQGRRRPRRRSPHVPTRRDILASLTQLTQLVATGLISPAQSNAMRGALTAILDELPKEPQQAGTADGDTSRLRKELRRQPDLLDAIQHLLSDEQLRELIEDEGDGQGPGGGAAPPK